MILNINIKRMVPWLLPFINPSASVCSKRPGAEIPDPATDLLLVDDAVDLTGDLLGLYRLDSARQNVMTFEKKHKSLPEKLYFLGLVVVLV